MLGVTGHLIEYLVPLYTMLSSVEISITVSELWALEVG